MKSREPKAPHWKARENTEAKVAAYVLAIECFAWHCKKSIAEILPTVERWTASNWADLAPLAGKSPPNTSKPLIIAALRARAEREARQALLERLVQDVEPRLSAELDTREWS